MNKTYLIVTIENIIITIIFGILSVIFHHWWIILFSILCYSSVRNSDTRDTNNIQNKTVKSHNTFSIKFIHIDKYSAIIYANSYINPIDDLDKIEKELLNNNQPQGFILFDLLLSNGESFNRFADVYFDGTKFDEKTLDVSLKNFTQDELKIINSYYRGKKSELNNSILTKSKIDYYI